MRKPSGTVRVAHIIDAAALRYGGWRSSGRMGRDGRWPEPAAEQCYRPAFSAVSGRPDGQGGEAAPAPLVRAVTIAGGRRALHHRPIHPGSRMGSAEKGGCSCCRVWPACAWCRRRRPPDLGGSVRGRHPEDESVYAQFDRAGGARLPIYRIEEASKLAPQFAELLPNRASSGYFRSATPLMGGALRCPLGVGARVWRVDNSPAGKFPKARWSAGPENP